MEARGWEEEGGGGGVVGGKGTIKGDSGPIPHSASAFKGETDLDLFLK